MPAALAPVSSDFVHSRLGCGVEFAADLLPERGTVALVFRMLTGVADEPEELVGLNGIVEHAMSKGTRRYDGQGLADAFDALGASWATSSGRQSTIVRVLCLPEFAADAVDLVAEMLCHPTFPDEACAVAVELAQQDLRRLDDEPDDVLRVLIQSATLGPRLGRHPGGTVQTLARIEPRHVREHWQAFYGAGRLQVAVAGPVDATRLARRVDAAFSGFGAPTESGRDALAINIRAARVHQHKELEQQYLALTMPGLPKSHPDFPVEQVLLRVLAGGMSGRLFTEVREKLGLVYSIGAWHEHPRGAGVIHVSASTTPQRCHETYRKVLEELRRAGQDLEEAEFVRARDGLIAHAETEDDLTRARAGGLSEDLFHFGRPVGLGPRITALRRVTRQQVADYAQRLPLDRLCIATLGPRELTG